MYNDGHREREREKVDSFYMRTSVPTNTTDADITDATTKPSSPNRPADVILIALLLCGLDPLAGKPEMDGSYSLGVVLLDTPFQQYSVKHALH